MPPLGAAAIAGIVGAVAAAGSGIASAVIGKDKGNQEVPAVQLTPGQTSVANNLEESFGGPVSGRSTLGQELVAPAGSLRARLNNVISNAAALRNNPPNTNRFNRGGAPLGSASQGGLGTASAVSKPEDQLARTF